MNKRNDLLLLIIIISIIIIFINIFTDRLLDNSFSQAQATFQYYELLKVSVTPCYRHHYHPHCLHHHQHHCRTFSADERWIIHFSKRVVCLSQDFSIFL